MAGLTHCVGAIGAVSFLRFPTHWVFIVVAQNHNGFRNNPFVLTEHEETIKLLFLLSAHSPGVDAMQQNFRCVV